MSWIHTPSYEHNIKALENLAEISNDMAKKFLDFVDKSKDVFEISPKDLLDFIKHAKLLGIKYAFKLCIKDKYLYGEQQTKDKLEIIAIENGIYNWELPKPIPKPYVKRPTMKELISSWESF